MKFLASRIIAACAVVLFVAFPVTSALVEPSVFLWVKVLWVALTAMAFVRPQWSPYVLVALVPLVPWLPAYSLRIPQGLVHLIVLSQALPWLGRYVVGKATIVRDRLSWAWALLVGVAVASVLTHYGGYQAVYDSWSAFWVDARGDLFRYVLDSPNIEMENMIIAATAFADGLLAYLVVRSGLAVTGARPVPLLGVVAATGIAASLFGFYQMRTHLALAGMWRANDPGIIRINATYTDPNAFASYLALLIPIAIGLAARAVGRERLAWLGGTALMVMALVMTAGRAGLIGAVAGIAVVLVLPIFLGLDRADPWPWVARHFRKIVYSIAALTLAVLVTLIAVGTIFDFRHQQQNTYLHTWLFTFNLRQPLDQIAKGRFANWETAALMAKDHPFFGLGVGRVFRFFATYNRFVGGAPEGARFSAHNTFLNVAAEMGVVGLTALSILLAGAYAITIDALRRASEAASRRMMAVTVGLLGGLFAYTLTMIPGDRFILREDIVTFAAVLAIAAAVRESVTRPLSQQGQEGVVGAWARRTAAFALIAIVATVPLRAAYERRSIRFEHVVFGLHDVEAANEVRYRWTTAHATFYRPSRDADVTLEVRSLAPFPQTISVRFNDVEIDRLTLVDHNWRASRYPVPPRVKDAPYLKIELEVTPIFRPDGDARELGVMLKWNADR